MRQERHVNNAQTTLNSVNWLLIFTVAYDWLSSGGDRIGLGHDRANNNVSGIEHLTYLKHWSWS
jgi:hypothetical protein